MLHIGEQHLQVPSAQYRHLAFSPSKRNVPVVGYDDVIHTVPAFDPSELEHPEVVLQPPAQLRPHRLQI